MAFDNLISRRAQNKRASGIYRRKERIAVFKAVFEVCERLAELFDKPIEFPFLLPRHEWKLNQHP